MTNKPQKKEKQNRTSRKKVGNLVLVRCFINSDWKEMGHARVTIIKPEGQKVAVASFLTDLFCLGVKNTMGEKLPEKMVDMFVAMIYFDGAPLQISLEFAKEVVYGALHYAKKIGFDPDPDFEEWKYVLGDDPTLLTEEVQFGDPENNGKPLYVIGPDDNFKEIIATLKRNVGLGNFSVVAPEDFLGN